MSSVVISLSDARKRRAQSVPSAEELSGSIERHPASRGIPERGITDGTPPIIRQLTTGEVWGLVNNVTHPDPGQTPPCRGVLKVALSDQPS